VCFWSVLNPRVYCFGKVREMEVIYFYMIVKYLFCYLYRWLHGSLGRYDLSQYRRNGKYSVYLEEISQKKSNPCSIQDNPYSSDSVFRFLMQPLMILFL
jgi:hypothetical protein